MNALKKISKAGLIMAVLAVPLIIYLNLQSISDWWRLSNYQPSERIASIAIATTMTDYGKKLFYVHYPELLDKDTFRQNCTNAEESIVLGCYIEGQGIYIYNVADERLNGVHEVTSAHETLHAAYERLSYDERQRVDKLTAEALAGLDNPRIQDTIEQYRARDADVVPNELHSILGTEVRDLSDELEAYYAKYFNNRLAIVELSEKYEAVFTEREKQIKTYDSKLETMKKQIDKLQADLETQAKNLSSRRTELEAMLSSGQTDAYNSAVPAFNVLVGSYNQGVKQVKALIAEYNALVAQRNDIASEEQALIDAIDTRLTPAATE